MAIEESYHVQVIPASALWPWVARRSAWLVAGRSVRAKGKSAYSEIFGKAYRSGTMPLAETALWLEHNELKRETLKGDSCWSKG
eukprot:14655369-Alexandrium_andersonii.AAC.1